MVYDGSFQYAIPSSAKLQIDQSFCEQNYTSSVEHQVHLTDPTDSISLKLRIEDSYISLEEWANRQKNSWLFSEIGEMNYGQKFINEAGFAGIVMLREQNNIEEIIIGIDLTTEEWNSSKFRPKSFKPNVAWDAKTHPRANKWEYNDGDCQIN